MKLRAMEGAIRLIEAGLVLEGGGMRGVYTAGALDCLMDNGLWYGAVYGVSAGACHGTSYVSRQRGRAARTVLDYVGDRRYASLHNLVTTGNFFGERFTYEEIPNKLVPFDYEAYADSGVRFVSVVTNCRTGEAEYPVVRDLRKQMPYILASSSLPLMAKLVWIEGEPYLDGGVVDSIPIERSIADGNRRNLVILTQHEGYQKHANKLMPLIAMRYRAYPRLVAALRVRHERYNAQLAAVYREVEAGRAVVIQPSTPVMIKRLEKDRERLQALYAQGYRDAEARLDAVKGVFAG